MFTTWSKNLCPENLFPDKFKFICIFKINEFLGLPIICFFSFKVNQLCYITGKCIKFSRM